MTAQHAEYHPSLLPQGTEDALRELTIAHEYLDDTVTGLDVLPRSSAEWNRAYGQTVYFIDRFGEHLADLKRALDLEAPTA
jgi:hypothetical protein